MNIVDWKTLDKGGDLEGLDVKVDESDRKNIFKTLLKRTVSERWSGKVCRKNGQYEKTLAPRVEIRKRLGDANVLMTVAKVVPSPWKNVTDEVVTLVSMNGTAQLTSDDFVEMNLAAAEARGMYDALIERENGKD